MQPDTPKYKKKAWLEEQYLNQRRTTVEMADATGVSASTIRGWMDKYGIERRCRAEAQAGIPIQKLKQRFTNTTDE